MAQEELLPSSNKLAIIQVLAALIKNPLLFADNNYRFSISDFPEQFHQIVFGAIEHLALKGMQKIDYIDIDQFLKQYTVQYKVFCANNGILYIQNCLKLYDEKKFDYYYNTLKKYSLINSLNAQGINTKDLYDPDIVDPIASAAMQSKFDELTVNDILLAEETKIIMAKEIFGSYSDVVENNAGDGLKSLKERFKKTPDMGLPLVSPKLTTIYRGQRKGCLFMESAPSGTGKSRRAASEACHLAIPEYYNAETKKWVNSNFSESVLLISTELELSECQQMFMAFVSGVSESHIKDGKYYGDEEARVDKAIELINKSKLYFVSITNYDVDDIVNLIKKYKQLYNVNYVFFDYLSETLKITSSATKKTRVQGLRTDQILLQFSSSLKDVAKQLNIYIWTSSQLSGDYKNAKELDASYLRSAKSLSDKIDAGSIMMPTRECDQEVIDSYCAKGFETIPNFVISVYKVRAGSYQNIKVYVKFDRATCQMTDCFVTDNKGNLLPVEDTNIELILDDTKTEVFEEAYNEAYNPVIDIDF